MAHANNSARPRNPLSEYVGPPVRRLDKIASRGANPDDVEKATADVCRFFNNAPLVRSDDGTSAVSEEVLLTELINFCGHYEDAAASAIKGLLDVRRLVHDSRSAVASKLMKDAEFADAGAAETWPEELRQRFRTRLELGIEAGDEPPWLRSTPLLLDVWLGREPKFPGGKRPRMSVGEAEIKAKQLASANRKFLKESQRQWAKKIGCSVGTVAKLPSWIEELERSGRGKRSKGPRTVSLTDKVLQTHGEEDETLTELIQEHYDDMEPSPLDPDPVDGPKKKVRTNKRL